MLLEAAPCGAENCSPIMHLPLGATDIPEHVSLAILNGMPGEGVLPISTVAVLLMLVKVINLVAPVDPAATGAKTTVVGAFSETAVPLPESPTETGVAPLYGTDSDPDIGPSPVGENCSIIPHDFLGRTV